MSSIVSGDATFSEERLDPHVVAQLGAAACHAKLTTPLAGFATELVTIGRRGPWSWPLPGGGSVDIPDVQYATAKVTDTGATAQVEIHFSIVDGTYHWFTTC